MGAEKNPARLLLGPDKANRAHVLGRTALIAVLARDTRVTGTFGEFDIADLASQLGALGEDLARAAGLPGRAHLFAPEATVPLTAEYRALNDRFTEQLQRTLPALRQRLEALVYDVWHLEWPWLVFELLDHYQRLLNSLTTGDGWAGSFGLPAPTLPAPPAPTRGESREAYLRRLRAFYPPAPPAKSGRQGVRVNPDRIARDVHIFYCLRLKHEPDSIYAVAKELRCSPYKVKLAVARAIRLLSAPVPRVPRRTFPE
jgi:hypothetical protein